MKETRSLMFDMIQWFLATYGDDRSQKSTQRFLHRHWSVVIKK